MSNMESLLLGMDKTDKANNNGKYLQSRALDVGRGNDIPAAWQGQSRVQLIEKLEKLALEYGKRHQRTDPKLLTDTLLSGVASQSSADESLRHTVESRLSKRSTLHGERWRPTFRGRHGVHI